MDSQKFNDMADATGIFDGDTCSTRSQVRAYLTVENMEDMFGACDCSQSELDEFARAVIEANGL